MITLTDDQEDIRTQTRIALRTYGSVLVYAPPGWGKTVFSAALIKLIAAAGKKVIFAVHRLALLRQTAGTLEKFGLPYSYIAAGYHHNIYRNINVASIDTLKNRLGKHDADYLFVDEAHLSASDGWRAVVAYYISIGCKVIGLSGTPIRADGRPLGSVWNTMILGPSPRWLIDNNRLGRYRAFSPAGIDVSKLRVRNGEHIASEVDELIAGKAVMSGGVRHWRERAFGKRTIAFVPSVKRGLELATEFAANGYTFVPLDGNTPQADRNAAFNALADRQIHGLINVNLFIEGFDMAAQVGRDVPVEAVLDMSPCLSLARHIQKNTRPLRLKPDNSDGILIDLVGGLMNDNLGLPDDDRDWSLEGDENGKRTGKQEERSRLCPKCGASHEPAPKCACGHVYEIKSRKVSEVEGELAEIDLAAARAARKQQEQQSAWSLADKIKKGQIDDPALAKEVEYLMKSVTAKGSKHPEKWAARVLTARMAKRNAA